ncbi:alkene reductase [Ruegeria profundi]|uniref:alkene reductase n=1 Tax=Ruegeria profundi TaxID=1685378 RepID=UPI001CD7AF2B|nr:alkene reductase [Ruegeria profundi]MCA0928175.1 alkene reductase [Ruegeria profundi]
MKPNLFSPIQIGDLKLRNRMVMAPLSRSRATPEGVPTPLMIEHYRQRASAGLIITESAPVSHQGVGYPCTPGLYTPEQTAGWLRVVNAVHAQGGRIFAQLQHCGRISHNSHQPNGRVPVAPSAVLPDGVAFTATGYQPFETPRALEAGEIKDVIAQYRQAAENCLAAGFDGVEVHAGNGYLIDQFLRDGTNKREDAYGGSTKNRMRFLNEVLDAVTDVLPVGRIGVRLSPENTFNSMSDSDPQRHFEEIVDNLSGRGLGYLHVLETSMDFGGHVADASRTVDYGKLRKLFSGPYIANNGYTKERAEKAIQSGHADLISFGAAFLSNPDLVRRFKKGLPLNKVDKSTFYTGGATGYTDYPQFSAEFTDAA